MLGNSFERKLAILKGKHQKLEVSDYCLIIMHDIADSLKFKVIIHLSSLAFKFIVWSVDLVNML